MTRNEIILAIIIAFLCLFLLHKYKPETVFINLVPVEKKIPADLSNIWEQKT